MDAADGSPINVVYVNNAGNVGIGTTNPTEKLEVNGTVKANILKGDTLRMWNYKSDTDMEFTIDSTDDPSIYASFDILNGAGNLIFTVTEGGFVYIHDDTSIHGQLGIGRLNATEKLDVNGNVLVNGEVKRPSTGSANLVPIAYGNISSAGTIYSGTGNFYCTWNTSNNWYEISITNENYFWSSYITMVTPTTGSFFTKTGSVSGKLIVELKNSSGSRVQGGFSFVTYKP